MAKNVKDVTEFDFGFSFQDDLESNLNAVTEKAAIAEDKAQTLYNMFIPLLNNLKKFPDKPNIYWPDRVKKIDSFIEKMDQVLNS